MEFIAVEEEISLLFDEIVPDRVRDRAIVLDVGSGETKGAYLADPQRDRSTLFDPDLDACDPERRDKIQEDIKQIQRTFSSDNLIAGAEILRALSQELGLNRRDRLFFARHAIEALPVGYLRHQLERPSPSNQLRSRLEDIASATTVRELAAGRPHPLKGDRD